MIPTAGQSRINEIILYLQQLSEELKLITSEPLSESIGSLEIILGILNDIWQSELIFPHFPQSRMKNLIEIIANELVRIIQNQLGQVQFWDDSYVQVEFVLLSADCDEILGEGFAGTSDRVDRPVAGDLPETNEEVLAPIYAESVEQRRQPEPVLHRQFRESPEGS